MGQLAIPCMLIRGGTSKGAYFLRDDLPADVVARDAFQERISSRGSFLPINAHNNVLSGGAPDIAIHSRRSTQPRKE